MTDMAGLDPLILQPVGSVIMRVYCIPMREKQKHHMNHIVILAAPSWSGESHEPHSSFQKTACYGRKKNRFLDLETIFCSSVSKQQLRIVTKIGVEVYIPCFSFLLHPSSWKRLSENGQGLNGGGSRQMYGCDH